MEAGPFIPCCMTPAVPSRLFASHGGAVEPLSNSSAVLDSTLFLSLSSSSGRCAWSTAFGTSDELYVF